MKRSRRIMLLISGFLALFLIAACGTKPANPPSPPAQEQNNGTGAETPAPAPAPETQAKTAKVLIYYSNHDLTAMEKEEQEITFNTDEEKYAKAMELLGKPSKPEHQPLWPNFAFHSITLKNGKLTIDADSKNQYNLGSTGEMMAIEALRMTMFQFPEVQSIIILVDGKPTETLMGHVDVSQPIPR